MIWLLLALPCLAMGQDWGSLSILNVDVPLSRRWTVQMHGRLRTNDNFSSYFQTRVGPIAYFKANRRLTLIGGSYFTNERDSTGEPRHLYRVFGGATVVVPTPRFLKWEARTLVERFLSAPGGDFGRVRERFWFTFGNGKVRPYSQVEGLIHRGVPVGRFGAGLQFRAGLNRDVFVGYEYRQLPNGQRLQLITSNIQFVWRRWGG